MSALAQFDAVLWQDNFGDLSEAEQRDVLWSASWDLWRLSTRMRDGALNERQAACHTLIAVTGNLGYVRCAHDLRTLDQAMLAGQTIDPSRVQSVLDVLCHIGRHVEQRIDALWPQGGGKERGAGVAAIPS